MSCGFGHLHGFFLMWARAGGETHLIQVGFRPRVVGGRQNFLVFAAGVLHTGLGARAHVRAIGQRQRQNFVPLAKTNQSVERHSEKRFHPVGKRDEQLHNADERNTPPLQKVVPWLIHWPESRWRALSRRWHGPVWLVGEWTSAARAGLTDNMAANTNM